MLETYRELESEQATKYQAAEKCSFVGQPRTVRITPRKDIAWRIYASLVIQLGETAMSIRLVKSSSSLSHLKHEVTDHALASLKLMLRDLFRARHDGMAYAKLTHLQGTVDGYMRCLMDQGTFTDAQLLTIVGESRRGVDGPATCVLDSGLSGEGTQSFEASKATA